MDAQEEVLKNVYDNACELLSIHASKEDFYHLSECEYILKKDSLFDRYIITDFEFEPRADGSLTPYPVCPKCGARRFS